jgi:nitrogen fixation protein FixH
MSPTVLPTAPRHPGLRGGHVLGIFLGFFAAVFVVNGAMIYSAVTTHSGLVANEPYRKGLHYNERIAADRRQASLGWTETLEVGRDGSVRLALTEADGRPVRGVRRALRRWRKAIGCSRSRPAYTKPRTPSTACGGAYGSSPEQIASRQPR